MVHHAEVEIMQDAGDSFLTRGSPSLVRRKVQQRNFRPSSRNDSGILWPSAQCRLAKRQLLQRLFTAAFIRASLASSTHSRNVQPYLRANADDGRPIRRRPNPRKIRTPRLDGTPRHPEPTLDTRFIPSARDPFFIVPQPGGLRADWDAAATHWEGLPRRRRLQPGPRTAGAAHPPSATRIVPDACVKQGALAAQRLPNFPDKTPSCPEISSTSPGRVSTPRHGSQQMP